MIFYVPLAVCTIGVHFFFHSVYSSIFFVVVVVVVIVVEFVAVPFFCSLCHCSYHFPVQKYHKARDIRSIRLFATHTQYLFWTYFHSLVSSFRMIFAVVVSSHFFFSRFSFAAHHHHQQQQQNPRRASERTHSHNANRM